MQGKATVGGHPIHPMLVTLPIGFFVGALASDVVGKFGDPAFWPRMAVSLVAFGLISAVLAAIAGVIDYVTAPMSAEAKRVASAHFVANMLVVAIFAVEFFVRTIDITSLAGYLLEVIGIITLGISGYLGGHLTFKYRVGSQPELPPYARTERGTIGARRRTTRVG